MDCIDLYWYIYNKSFYPPVQVSPWDLSKKLRADSPIFICINNRALALQIETFKHLDLRTGAAVDVCHSKDEVTYYLCLYECI